MGYMRGNALMIKCYNCGAQQGNRFFCNQCWAGPHRQDLSDWIIKNDNLGMSHADYLQGMADPPASFKLLGLGINVVPTTPTPVTVVTNKKTEYTCYWCGNACNRPEFDKVWVCRPCSMKPDVAKWWRSVYNGKSLEPSIPAIPYPPPADFKPLGIPIKIELPKAKAKKVYPKCKNCANELSPTMDAYYGKSLEMKEICLPCRPREAQYNNL